MLSAKNPPDCDTLPLVATPRALLDLGTPVTYNRLWQLAVDGRVPATMVSGKWRIAKADLPGIAATLKR